MTLRLAGDYTLFVLAIVVCTFTALYFARSWFRKKKNRVGNIYMAKSIFLSMVLIQVSASVIYKSDYWNRDYIRLVVYGVGVVAYVVMIVSLIREQNRDRREAAELQAKYDDLVAKISEGKNT